LRLPHDPCQSEALSYQTFDLAVRNCILFDLAHEMSSEGPYGRQGFQSNPSGYGSYGGGGGYSSPQYGQGYGGASASYPAPSPGSGSYGVGGYGDPAAGGLGDYQVCKDRRSFQAFLPMARLPSTSSMGWLPSEDDAMPDSLLGAHVAIECDPYCRRKLFRNPG
jgi:hypothetical protein